MDINLLQGALVRLTAEDPETFAKAHSRWDRDSEFKRLLDSEPSSLFSVRQLTEWIQKDMEKLLPFTK